MKSEDYKRLSDQLNLPTDIKNLSRELGLDEELLNVIYNQRTVRKMIKEYYYVERYTNQMSVDWYRGMSLLQISEKAGFSPILTGMLIFKEWGRGKKEFWIHVHNPETIPNDRLRREIIEITEADHVYSPWAAELQSKRGVWGEEKLQCWLKDHDIGHRTEKDLRGEFTKTPDCLFDKPVSVNGWKLNWIESKATFGDLVEWNKNLKKQLAPYREMFGQGLVVYWFGYVDEIVLPEGVYIMDASLTDQVCKYLP